MAIKLITMVDRKKFYDSIRTSLFGGSLKQSQVDGMEAILNEWEKRDLKDLRWLAYILATAFHETAKTMQPIREYGLGKNYRYGKPDPITGKAYYGRGLIQLTWIYNYIKMGKILGVDLYRNPDLALNLEIAVNIMFEGMMKAESSFGDFTGKCLEQYFNDTTEDWYNARRIINGVDCAAQVADYGKKFYDALK